MRNANEHVDAVVVGSGAAGSLYAAVLAEAGKSVAVLERGPPRKLSDLYSSQIWARRLKWASPPVVEDGADRIGFNFNAGHGYGGAAIHHYAVWPRFHIEDFRERTLYGRSLDWPFDYSELRPFYDQIQREVGISGDADREIWRPPGDPYPLPPTLVSQHGIVLARGFDTLGMHTAPMPVAILSRPYKGRPACIWDGWCDAGCPTGALANPLVTYLPRAQKGGARLYSDAHVTRVLTDKAGKRATGVEYRRSTGESVFQPAHVVILCAFTVENARILLNSSATTHPQGLANSSGLVGRYLMAHPSVQVAGMFREEMQNYLGVTGGQLLCQDAFRERNGSTFGSRQWQIALAMKPNDLLGIAMTRPDLFGSDLHRFMREGARFQGTMAALCQDEPVWANRITLTHSTDQFGLPLARAVYTRSASGTALGSAAASEGVRIFKAAGAREAWHGPLGAGHLMGGTILGSERTKSVLNAHSQSHDVLNLFVGGPGVFPTSSAVNPTFTVQAIALKSAQFMLKHWASL